MTTSAVVIVISSLLGYSLYFRMKLGVDLFSAFFVVVSSIILVGYISSFVGAMSLFSYAITVGGLVLFVSSVFKGKKEVSRNGGSILFPALMIGLIVVLLNKVTQGGAFNHWDEFSHWGLVAKLIVSENSLPDSSLPLLFFNYPHGSALFYYWVTSFAGYAEDVIIFSHNILLVSSVLAIVGIAKYKAIGRPLVAGLLLYILAFLFGVSVYAIYQDYVLGLWSAAVVVTYYRVSREGYSRYILIPPLIALVLFKPISIVFAYGVVGLLLLDTLVRYTVSRGALKERGGQFFREQCFPLLVASILVWGVSSHWNSYVDSLGSHKALTPQVSVGNMLNTFFDGESDKDALVKSKYYKAFFDKDVSTRETWQKPLLSELISEDGGQGGWVHVGVSAFWWLVLLTFASAFLIIKQKEVLARTRLIALFGSALIGGVGYLFLLLLSYLFVFDYRAGVTLASFERYFSTYVIFWIAILLVIPTLFGGYTRRLHSVFLGVSVGIAILLLPNTAARPFYKDAPDLSGARRVIQNNVSLVHKYVDKDEKVYVLINKPRGDIVYKVRYEIAPILINRDCHFVVSESSKVKGAECTMSLEQLRGRLSGYDYVLLLDMEASFWDEFGGMFIRPKAIGNQSFLYKVGDEYALVE